MVLLLVAEQMSVAERRFFALSVQIIGILSGTLLLSYRLARLRAKPSPAAFSVSNAGGEQDIAAQANICIFCASGGPRSFGHPRSPVAFAMAARAIW